MMVLLWIGARVYLGNALSKSITTAAKCMVRLVLIVALEKLTFRLYKK